MNKKKLLGMGVFTVFLVAFIVSFIVIDLPHPEVHRGMSDAVGCWMEGTVANISVNGDEIHFQMTGCLRLQQYRGPLLTHLSVIEANSKHGLAVTVKQWDRGFFAMSSDWRAGSLRKDGELAKILKAASERRLLVKLELVDPIVAFGGGSITNVETAVIRATDADLR